MVNNKENQRKIYFLFNWLNELCQNIGIWRLGRKSNSFPNSGMFQPKKGKKLKC
jgi:hypothetical protein